MSIGWTQILFVIFLAMLLFGAKKLPDLARSMGHALKEFKKGLHDEDSDITERKKEKE